MLIKTGLAVSQMSGTMGGVVASRNRYGNYFRRWALPVDPVSELQSQRRSAMSAAVAAWKLLSSADAETWNVYAANTPWTNRLGETVYLSGMQHFVRVFCFRRMVADQGGGLNTPLTSCGSTGGLPSQAGVLSVACDVVTGMSLSFDNSEGWANDEDAVLVVRMSQPRPASQVYCGSTFRWAWSVVVTDVPPISPNVVAPALLPFDLVEGDRVDALVRVYRSNNTMSQETQVTCIVTP